MDSWEVRESGRLRCLSLSRSPWAGANVWQNSITDSPDWRWHFWDDRTSTECRGSAETADAAVEIVEELRKI